MFKKMILSVLIVCLPSCFDTQKSTDKNISSPHIQKNIIPIDHIDSVNTIIKQALERGVKKEDIVAIFDVDETLLTSFAQKDKIRKQTTARDLFEYIADTVLRNNSPASVAAQIGLDNITIRNRELSEYLDPELIDAALRKAYYSFSALHNKGILSAGPVEKEVDSFIKQLQDDDITVMGLTARGLDMKDCTLKQLKAAGIDLTKKTVHEGEYLFNDLHGFSGGILFLTPVTKKFDKGQLLIQLFDELEYQPKMIIFIDDNLHFIENVQDALHAKYPRIQFSGLWYRYIKESDFDKELADQLIRKNFGDTWWMLDNLHKAQVPTRPRAN